MSREDILRTWSQRPSNTEQDRIDRTERMVRSAISHSPDYRVKNAKVFAKGSVKMHTNIRASSDIDLCVQAHGVFFADYPKGVSDQDFGNYDVDYNFTQFRKGVEDAMCGYFGYSEVDTSGSKAVRIRGTFSGSRIDADIVPAFEHRSYTSPGSTSYQRGIEFVAKTTDIHVINWPHHNYENSIQKHEATGRRYRKMIRVLKRMREAMKEAGYQSANSAASFLIESLLWNVPSDRYGNLLYVDDMKKIFDHLVFWLATDERVKEWGEVNELKYLFGSWQKWTRQEAEAFIRDASTFMEAMS